MAHKDNSLHWEVEPVGKQVVLRIGQKPIGFSIALPVYLAKALGEALVVEAEVVKERRDVLR